MAQDDSKSPSPTFIQSSSAHIRNGKSLKEATADAPGITLKRFKYWLLTGEVFLARYEEGIEEEGIEGAPLDAQLYHACYHAALDHEREKADALDHEMGLVEIRAKAVFQPTPHFPTPDLITLISKLIRYGVEQEAAAEKVGISPNKLKRWLSRGQEELARLEGILRLQGISVPIESLSSYAQLYYAISVPIESLSPYAQIYYACQPSSVEVN